MTWKTLLSACLALLVLTIPLAAQATADDLDQAFKEAKKAAESRNAAATLKALRVATSLAWERLPFGVLEVHLLAAPPAGYGQYLPRVDNQYRQNEPMILYMEPVGFKVRHDPKEGTYTYKLTADFNLIDAWGRVVGGRRDFGRFGGQSQQFPDREPLSFTYSLSGLPPGDYRVETTLRDLLGEKSHTVVTSFKIVGP
jgi:hypothetical protein